MHNQPTFFPQRDLPKVKNDEPDFSENSSPEAVFDFRKYTDYTMSEKYYRQLVSLVKLHEINYIQPTPTYIHQEPQEYQGEANDQSDS